MDFLFEEESHAIAQFDHELCLPASVSHIKRSWEDHQLILSAEKRGDIKRRKVAGLEGF